MSTNKIRVIPENTNLEMLNGIYIHELWWLSTNIINKCQQLFDMTKIPEGRGFLASADPNIHSLICSILSDAANIKKILDTSDRRGNESLANAEARQNRASYLLNEVLSSLQLTTILNSDLRNSLEHFDERLDKLITHISESPTLDKNWVAYNMTFSSWAVKSKIFDSRVSSEGYLLRVYIADERKFHISYEDVNKSVDLNAIYIEASSIVDLVKQHSSIKDLPNTGPGACVFLLKT